MKKDPKPWAWYGWPSIVWIAEFVIAIGLIWAFLWWFMT